MEPEVPAAPAQNLLEDFYNLYEIPVEHGEGDGALDLRHGPGLLRRGGRFSADRELHYRTIKQELDAGLAVQTSGPILDMHEDRLASLRARPGQSLDLTDDGKELGRATEA
jgi:hypothetical protein